MRRDGVANRERILLAAEDVFGAQGAAGSTEDVARSAEVGIATVFRHFPTKQDLIEATAVRYLEKMESEVRSFADVTDPGQALASITRVLVSTGPIKATLVNLTLTDGEELPEPIVAGIDAVRSVVRLALERAQASDAVRPDATVNELFTLARALALVSKPGNDTVDRTIDIVLDGLGVVR